MVEFNADKHFLGTLCKHGHEYEDTGKSLRFKSTQRCCACKREWAVNNREKVRKIQARRNKREVERLSTRYVKDKIFSEGGSNSFKEIPEHIVEGKRGLLKLCRKIREVEKHIKEAEGSK